MRKRSKRTRAGAGVQRGFTYLTVLFAVALIGFSLALTGKVWHTAQMREKEAELLYVGNCYRRAIGLYYTGGPSQYPRKLADLLKDARKAGTVRYLRKLYPDPIIGTNDWGLVKAQDGGIMGVYSRSTEKPFKVAEFGVNNAEFSKATKYSDWKFVYTPPGQNISPVSPAQSAPQVGATGPMP
jgi:type II secretory pathway pseudopilin PulG